MPKAPKTLKVAVVQASPILFNLEETLQKTLSLISEASRGGAELVVFPESFIPAYPRGMSFGFVVGSRTNEGRIDWKRYYDESVAVPGPAVDALAAAAGAAHVYLSIGVTEKDGYGHDTSLYCTNLFFSNEGQYLGKHRKLKPTGSERLIWGEGDASTLNVFDTPFGKIGSLICWENYMPLARVALYQKGIELYIAPTADSRQEWQASLRHIALEGRVFVIGCNQYVEKSMVPKDLMGYSEIEGLDEVLCSGGSCVIDPMGQYVVGPLYGREDILMCELDLDLIVQSRMDFDVVGHYSRPDVFNFSVRENLN